MHPLTVFELRNYVMRPGRRDALIEIFEREFIESQEELGSRVVGTFRNLDEPDRFVWFRAFENMETRRAALDGFYTSPLWLSLRNEANATMIDSDDVLLLKPRNSVVWAQADRAPKGATNIPEGLIVCATYFLQRGDEDAFAAYFADDIAPHFRDAGAEIVATLSTEHAINSYPRLPVRDNETVFVALLRPAGDDRDANRVVASAKWNTPHLMRLQPTPRSALR